MKYIMFEDFAGEPVPVIFPNRIGFEEMREQIPYASVLSAGFVQVRGGAFVCHGEAKELQARARAGDGPVLDAKFAAPED